MYYVYSSCPVGCVTTVWRLNFKFTGYTPIERLASKKSYLMNPLPYCNCLMLGWFYYTLHVQL